MVGEMLCVWGQRRGQRVAARGHHRGGDARAGPMTEHVGRRGARPARATVTRVDAEFVVDGDGQALIAVLEHGASADGGNHRIAVEIASGQVVLTVWLHADDTCGRGHLERIGVARRMHEQPSAHQAQPHAEVDPRVGVPIEVHDAAVGCRHFGAAIGRDQAVVLFEQVRRLGWLHAGRAHHVDAAFHVHNGEWRWRVGLGILREGQGRCGEEHEPEGPDDQLRTHVRPPPTGQASLTGASDSRGRCWLTEYSNACARQPS